MVLHALFYLQKRIFHFDIELNFGLKNEKQTSRSAFVIPLGFEPRALPINRDAQPLEAIRPSMYFLDFIFLI